MHVYHVYIVHILYTVYIIRYSSLAYLYNTLRPCPIIQASCTAGALAYLGCAYRMTGHMRASAAYNMTYIIHVCTFPSYFRKGKNNTGKQYRNNRPWPYLYSVVLCAVCVCVYNNLRVKTYENPGLFNPSPPPLHPVPNSICVKNLSVCKHTWKFFCIYEKKTINYGGHLLLFFRSV